MRDKAGKEQKQKVKERRPLSECDVKNLCCIGYGFETALPAFHFHFLHVSFCSRRQYVWLLANVCETHPANASEFPATAQGIVARFEKQSNLKHHQLWCDRDV